MYFFMKQVNSFKYGFEIIMIILLLCFNSCDKNSSPEGRMSLKIESLQKEMLESMQQQNKAILDSLGKIREELNELKRQKNWSLGKPNPTCSLSNPIYSSLNYDGI